MPEDIEPEAAPDFSEELQVVMAAVSATYDNIGNLGDPQLQVRYVLELQQVLGYNIARAFTYQDGAERMLAACRNSFLQGFQSGLLSDGSPAQPLGDFINNEADP